MQMSDALYSSSLMTVSLMLSLVTAIGTSSTDGTLLVDASEVIDTPPIVVGLVPASRATASSAAPVASGLIALYTVIDCEPVRMRVMASFSASWPVSGMPGGMTLEIVVAMPSFAL